MEAMSAFTPDLLALHLGALHAYEKALVFVLAFGPFVALAVVVSVVRRRDIAREEAAHAAGSDAAGDPAGDTGTDPAGDAGTDARTDPGS